MIERYEFSEEQARMMFPNTLRGLQKAQRILGIELARRYEEVERDE